MEEKKNNTGLAVLITIMVLIILGLTGFIMYDKVLKKDKVEPKTTENNEIIEENVGEEEESNINLTEAAKTELDSVVFHLSSLFLLSKWSYDVEYFNDYDFKFSFVWKEAVSNLDYSDINQYGEEETGSNRFFLDMFKDYYKKIINENFDITKLNKKSDFYKNIGYPTIKSEYIYGENPTGYDITDTKLKLNSLTYNQNTKEYTIKMDGVTFDLDIEDLKPTGETAYLKYQLDDVGNRIYTSFIVKE